MAKRTTLSFDELNTLSPDSEPFNLTDKIVEGYVLKMVRKFSKLRTKIKQQDDLYAIMMLIYAAYDESWELYHECLSETFRRQYLARLPSARYVDADAEFLAFMTAYVSPEGYVPQKEWQRKRDRCFESVAAAWHGNKQIRAPVESARNAVVKQLKQGADDMTARAITNAYTDAGVRHVRWVTEHDSRVCKECAPRDGKVYSINKVPQWPAHYNCRCHIVAID